MTSSPISPLTTSLGQGVREMQVLLDRRALLEQVDVHALGDVPRHVTVQRPHARVVEVDLDDEVAVRPDELRVATLWVGLVDDRRAVPASDALGEDLHVVAVDVPGEIHMLASVERLEHRRGRGWYSHWMRRWEADGGHDDTDGAVGAEVDHLLLCGEVVVAQLGLETARLLACDDRP